MTTKFEGANDDDVINKVYLDRKIAESKGKISYIGKNLKKNRDHERYNEEVLIEKAVKRTFQKLSEESLFDKYDNADEFLKDCLRIDDVSDRPRSARSDLDELNDDKNVIQGFCLQIQFEKQSNIIYTNLQILSSLSFNDVKVYLGDESVTSDLKIVHLHLTKGTHWVAHLNEIYFDSYGCRSPNKLSRFIKKRNG